MLPADSHMSPGQAGRQETQSEFTQHLKATDRCGHEPFLITMPEQTTHSPPVPPAPRQLLCSPAQQQDMHFPANFPGTE